MSLEAVPISPGLLRVGYWWSDKKTKKFNANEFSKHCRKNGLELIKIDLDQPLNSQGPFSAIIHKLSDLLVKADLDDPQAKQICQRFQNYVLEHPEMVVIDPLDGVRKLLDRYKQYQLVQESRLGLSEAVFTPAFVELTTSDPQTNSIKLKESNVPFPIVCKPLLAHGTTLAHQMILVFCESGLIDIIPPCVAQTFVCHSAVLYKLFIIGKSFYVIERPSLKNFEAKERSSIFFDSHDISKPHSASPLNQLDADDSSIPHYPDPLHLKHIASVLQKELGLDLLGIDVIVDSETGRYAIIDMNTFPGYEGVDNVWQAMCDLILDRIKEHSTSLTEQKKPVTSASDGALRDAEIDSDIIGTVTNDPELCLKVEISKSMTHRCEFNLSTRASDSSITKTIYLQNDETVEPAPQPMEGSLPIIVPELCLKSTETCFQIPSIRGEVADVQNSNNESPETCPEISCIESFDTATEDSGIDTSDSCDEKKKSVKMVRRQHSRNSPLLPITTNVTLTK